MPYSPLLIKPFKEEVTEVGVQELLTPENVDNVMHQDGTTLVFVNSVCSCAAGTARPAIRKLLEGEKKFDRVVSVFAGQDLEATARFRNFIPDIPPSSPCFAIFKDKELVYFIPKHRIEGRNAESVCSDLEATLAEFA